MRIWECLKNGQERGASDLHLTVGALPVMRVNGELLTMPGTEPLQAEETAAMARELLTGELFSRLMEEGECDRACQFPEVGRFRVHAFKRSGHVSLSIRLITGRIPTPEELGISEAVMSLLQKRQGLFLVTGPAGSGKSTTLASLIDFMNRSSKRRIVTLEDPIEYVHEHRQSIIEQREVGVDTASFAKGLRAALRQDPDVILVGEMRDIETIATAMTAAETGHLVLATLHTGDAPQTIDRIIDAFPPEGQRQIRVQLASVLLGVVSQRLLPRSDGTGRIAVQEVLVNTPGVANLIRTEKVHQLRTAMQTGRTHGMQTFDMHLQDLVNRGLISEETAKVHRTAADLTEGSRRNV
jgi:twitching motility protein PilT